ncbi:hypothetical protein [Lysobacter humi (ex Lee et al. 2017)]
MNNTVVGLVTPHLLRVVDLANQAEKGINVDWHVRDAVSKSMADMRDLWNASALVSSYVEGLASAVAQAPASRPDYLRVLRAALADARALGRG